jgi:predicted nucleic acid-binding protein
VRDLLLRLALTNLFRAKWSDTIHEEWMRNVLEDRPDLTREQLERTRQLMDAHVRDCLITDFEKLIPTLFLPDPDDRHVLAAAIRGRADVIVTYNVKDFPAAILSRFDIEAQHPDEFVMQLIDLDVDAVCAAVRRQRQNLRRPPMSAEELLERLEVNHQLVETATRLRRFADLL